jgi:hypothetical protein
MDDSVDVAEMDTTAMWDRIAIPDTRPNGDTIGYNYGYSLDSINTDDERPFDYFPVVPDASPGVLFRMYGKAANKKGSAVRIIIWFFMMRGQPVANMSN